MMTCSWEDQYGITYREQMCFGRFLFKVKVLHIVFQICAANITTKTFIKLKNTKSNIKRAYEQNVVNEQVVTMTNKKAKTNSGATSSARTNNYFSPLPTIEDDIEDEEFTSTPLKVHIPPITVLKCKALELHDLCKQSKLTNFAIRKISIGLKLFCDSKNDFDTICKSLQNKYEFFTHATKNEKPYKALLFGLDKRDPSIIKNQLTELGLKCLDVKLVQKKGAGRTEIIIYVVYFQRQSISMKELRQNYSVIEYMKVKWDFQRGSKSKITQCYNCQMFGHGSSRCQVKTFCANCAGPHKTSECNESFNKCANCNEAHKSNSDVCQSKQNYLQMRERMRTTSRRSGRPAFSTPNYERSFPNNLNQTRSPTTSSWCPQRFTQTNPNANNNSSNLFSPEEIKNLTLELITNLRNCRSKADQFEVITNLACKFLS